jgi:lipopolysaccharide assembly outer membrane protein LptD (OstA)
MQYRNENIALMRADRARYEDQVIYFEGNVTLLHKKGLRFFTEQADYDKHSERIDVTAPFVAYVDRNRIRGSRMQFWLDSEEVYAEHIQAEVVIQHGNVARKGEEQ